MNIVVSYIFPLVEPKYKESAKAFVESYVKFPAGVEHILMVVCNGRNPSNEEAAIFKDIPCLFAQWDNTGWDIGAYIAIANSIIHYEMDCDMMVCCSAYSHFQREGWLRRLCDAWKKHGPGLYGTLASYQITPHLNTSGFACPPSLLATFPRQVISHKDRYEFEHGCNRLVTFALQKGLPAKLVTWDGDYEMKDWRKPPNIYFRGDQSNCVTLFNHTDIYATANAEQKRYFELLADTLTSALA